MSKRKNVKSITIVPDLTHVFPLPVRVMPEPWEEAGHIPHVRLAQCPEKKWLLYSDVERFRDRAEK